MSNLVHKCFITMGKHFSTSSMCSCQRFSRLLIFTSFTLFRVRSARLVVVKLDLRFRHKKYSKLISITEFFKDFLSLPASCNEKDVFRCAGGREYYYLMDFSSNCVIQKGREELFLRNINGYFCKRELS